MQTVEAIRQQIATIAAEFAAGCGPEGALATLRDEVDDAAYEEDDEEGEYAQLLAAFETTDEQTSSDAEWAEALHRELGL
jgi:hypothetical protein